MGEISDLQEHLPNTTTNLFNPPEHKVDNFPGKELNSIKLNKIMQKSQHYISVYQEMLYPP